MSSAPALREYLADPLHAMFVLAHGASAGQDHRSIVGLATHLAAHGVHTFTFNFPYIDAGRRRPDPPAVLVRAWLDVIDEVQRRDAGAGSLSGRPPRAGLPLFIGGRSMGGRLATHVASRGDDESRALSGVVCFGYPLHPPGRASARALDHFATIRCPVLVVQGTRDRFGGPDQVRDAVASVSHRVEVHAVADADHGLAVPRRSGRTPDDVLGDVAAQVAGWMRRVSGA